MKTGALSQQVIFRTQVGNITFPSIYVAANWEATEMYFILIATMSNYLIVLLSSLHKASNNAKHNKYHLIQW